MAMYPASLPAPSREGFKLSPVDPVARTEMESGQGRARRRSRVRNDVVDVRFVFTRPEMGVFRDWFDDDAGAAGGASWFSMVMDIGYGPLPYEARFKQVWDASMAGKNWLVSAKLEMRDAG